MLNPELESKIAKDTNLKLLVNQIKDEMLARGIVDARAQTNIIIMENQKVIEEYLNRHLVCEFISMNECKQKNPGFEDSISYDNGLFYLGIKRCANWNHDHKNENLKKQFVFLDYDLDQFNQTILEYVMELEKDIDIFTPQEILDRKQILNNAINKLNKYNKQNTGMYLYGNPGVGKTTLMKVLANEIASKNEKKVAFITVPNLINTIKDSFNVKHKNSSLLDKLKKVDVLFLDDIGAENVTNWSRDDLLFSILNYRMENQKITFFTSNFSMDDLNSTYLISGDNNKIELVKRKRFMERLKVLADVYILEGESHR